MAVVILATGMIFVSGVFPVAIHFSTIATERTVSAVVADEAFAKIKLIATSHRIDVNNFAYDQLFSFEEVVNYERARFPVTFGGPFAPIDRDEFMYPSTQTGRPKKYSWSALCRRTAYGDNSVQVTVFVYRLADMGAIYRDPNNPFNDDDIYKSFIPQPVRVDISATGDNDKIEISTNQTVVTGSAVNSFIPSVINDGYTIIDNQTGRLNRVLERDADDGYIVVLDKDWNGGNLGSGGIVWTVPAPYNGGRNPCIAIYQDVIRF